MKRIKPVGREFELFCQQWDTMNHAGKLALCKGYDISYDTGKHWRSDGDTSAPLQEPIEFVPPVSNTAPVALRTVSDMSTIAVIGDTHNPYQDDRAVALVENFLGQIQPDYLIYNGDINDFYQVSVFAKDPSRLGELQKDFDCTIEMFKRHSALLPNTKKIFIEGTHEVRWIKYLQQHAPALAKLNATNITELYRLQEYGIDHIPFERGVLVDGVFLVLHGEVCSAHSGYTAKRQYELQGGCGICNHTHRGGSYYKRNRFGVWGWWENFCLCRLDPDWLPNPDWVQGFSLVHFNSGGRFWVEQIPVINHEFMYGGKVYK